jgi:hypothetical protein
MAEGDASVHNNLKEQLMKKTIDFVNDVMKVALYDTNYTWSIDGADTAYADTNEISASGYTAGGATLADKAVTQDDTNNWGKFDATDVTWSSMAASAPKHAVLYDDTTATKWVLVHWELATDSNGGNYVLQFGANGIMTIS